MRDPAHLKGSTSAARLESLAAALERDEKEGFRPPTGEEVINHIHTIYSFSPYSPAEAAYRAWREGLRAVGIVDHESVAGCDEMIAAGRLLGLGVTTGCELRVSSAGTALEGRRCNNPDDETVFYMVIHGIPHGGRAEVEAALYPIRQSRDRRNRRQVERLNGLLAGSGLPILDYETQILPLSRFDEAGSVTERHILYALCLVLTSIRRPGPGILDLIETKLGLVPKAGVAERLSDPKNPHYLYDLLGLFKSSLVPRFYVSPDILECPSPRDIILLAERVGAVPAYPYLGDVGVSPTGDKSPSSFEDSWLDELFEALPALGFLALSYMPSRNSKEQLIRVRELCARHTLMEIGGEDINSPGQRFSCYQTMDSEFRHLRDNSWALVAHEQLAGFEAERGLFHPANPLADRTLEERLALYSDWGRRMDPARPESILSEWEDLWTD